MKRVPVSSTESWQELRSRYLTSTEAAALFGISLNMTSPFAMHFKKLGLLEAEDLSNNERVQAGSFLQPAIDRWIEARIGDEWKLDSWSTSTGVPKFFGVDDERPHLRMGTSLDLEATNRQTGKRRIIEIKNVDRMIFKEYWMNTDDGRPEPTLRIHLQGQHQMAVTGYDEIQYVPLVGGNELWCGVVDGHDRTILVKRDEKLIENLRLRVAQFWAGVDAGKTPEIDGGEATTKAINELLLNQGAGYTKPIEINDLELAIWCSERDGLVKQANELKAKLDKISNDIKWRLHDQHGDADKAVCNGWRINHYLVKAGEIKASERKAYRVLRVTTPKSTTEE